MRTFGCPEVVINSLRISVSLSCIPLGQTGTVGVPAASLPEPIRWKGLSQIES